MEKKPTGYLNRIEKKARAPHISTVAQMLQDSIDCDDSSKFASMANHLSLWTSLLLTELWECLPDRYWNICQHGYRESFEEWPTSLIVETLREDSEK